MIIVTGGTGFIGSCIVARLNELGANDIIIVDNLTEDKKKNIQNKRYIKYFDKKDFLSLIVQEKFNEYPQAIIHMGACSSTTLQDAQYFKENNLEYTRSLAKWALEHKIRFIYASSAATYGDGSIGYKDDDATIRQCKPLNLYGQSKQDFDMWVLDHGLINNMTGLKFFNVFGPNEYHKKDMRSVVAKTYERAANEGKISLFKSYLKDYKDGEQKRDFIYVKDAVDIVMFFLDRSHVNGIYNVGTGQASTWNELAQALFAAVRKTPMIEYVEMPEDLKNRYQYFTQADMAKLKRAGYSKPFTPLNQAVLDYVEYLKNHQYL